MDAARVIVSRWEFTVLAKLNLKRMSISELVALRDRVQSALSEKIEQERMELQNQMEELQNLESLPAAPNGSRRSRVGRQAGKVAKSRPGSMRCKVAPKYRGPKGETWTGRGRAPRWLVGLEAQGKKRENYLIQR